jgi:hypothetical protein
MKKFIFFIVIAFTCNLSLVGCAVYSTATTNKWLEYELLPSKIVKNGSIFFEGRLSDGSLFTVFYDEEIDNDGEFYYAMLMQNWGWTRNGDRWSAPQSSRREKRGHIYINPKRGVGVYFYPEKHFNAFKVSISNKGASQ